jgi:protoheme ferro-lyase
VLYDIDVAAHEEAAAQDVDLVRVEMLNADPGLIRALAEKVHRTLSSPAGGLAIVK